MATSVCDRTPCEYMQAAIDALVTHSYRADRFSIRVLSQLDNRISFLVHLNYCPFCGSRFEPEWVRGFYKPVRISNKPTKTGKRLKD